MKIKEYEITDKVIFAVSFIRHDGSEAIEVFQANNDELLIEKKFDSGEEVTITLNPQQFYVMRNGVKVEAWLKAVNGGILTKMATSTCA